MSDLTFAQAERRNFLVPALIAIAVLAIIIVGIYLYVPHSVADITVTHVTVLPEHTVFKTDSKVVGQQAPFEDDFYILATVRVDNRLRVPLTLDDITGAITAPDGTETTTSALQKKDLPNLYAHLPRARAPRLRAARCASPSFSPRATPKEWSCSTTPSPSPYGTSASPPPSPSSSTTRTPSPSPSPNPDLAIACLVLELFSICFTNLATLFL